MKHVFLNLNTVGLFNVCNTVTVCLTWILILQANREFLKLFSICFLYVPLFIWLTLMLGVLSHIDNSCMFSAKLYFPVNIDTVNLLYGAYFSTSVFREGSFIFQKYYFFVVTCVQWRTLCSLLGGRTYDGGLGAKPQGFFLLTTPFKLSENMGNAPF